jgi:hypothetical protein
VADISVARNLCGAHCAPPSLPDRKTSRMCLPGRRGRLRLGEGGQSGIAMPCGPKVWGPFPAVGYTFNQRKDAENAEGSHRAGMVKDRLALRILGVSALRIRFGQGASHPGRAIERPRESSPSIDIVCVIASEAKQSLSAIPRTSGQSRLPRFARNDTGFDCLMVERLDPASIRDGTTVARCTPHWPNPRNRLEASAKNR